MGPILTAYVSILLLITLSLAFLGPISKVQLLKAKGTSEGYSSIATTYPLLMSSAWILYYWLVTDYVSWTINAICLVLNAWSAYWFIRLKEHNVGKSYAEVMGFAGCVVGLVVTSKTLPPTDAIELVGWVCAALNNLSTGPNIIEVINALKKGTTEFLPFDVCIITFTLVGGWIIYGIAVADIHIIMANLLCVVLQVVIMVLYFVIPPLTWKVPLFNIQPQQKLAEKME